MSFAAMQLLRTLLHAIKPASHHAVVWRAHRIRTTAFQPGQIHISDCGCSRAAGRTAGCVRISMLFLNFILDVRNRGTTPLMGGIGGLSNVEETKMKTRSILPIMTIGLVAAASAAPPPPPRFSVVSVTAAELSCPGDRAVVRCRAADINDAGDIVGAYSTVRPFFRAVVWRDGAMTELGTPDGMYGGATGINGLGEVVGWYGPTTPDYTPFHWSEATGLTTLSVSLYPGEPFDSHYGGQARAINEHGQIAGNVAVKDFKAPVPMEPCYRSLPTTWSHAFAEPLIDHCLATGEGYGMAADINRDGVIVGFEGYVSGYRGFISESGVVRFIPAPVPGLNTQGLGINDGGTVVGGWTLPDLARRAFIWDGRSALSQSLGVLPGGEYSEARAVNNLRFVAGTGDTLVAFAIRYRGFIWHRDFGLYALPPPPAMLPWVTDCRANSLNARHATSGIIQVVGVCDDRAVLWTVVTRLGWG